VLGILTTQTRKYLQSAVIC